MDQDELICPRRKSGVKNVNIENYCLVNVFDKAISPQIF